MALVDVFLSRLPKLRSDLRRAHMQITPREYVKKSLKLTLMYSMCFSVLFFFVLDKAELPIVLLLPIFVVLFFLLFNYTLLTVKAKIRKRDHAIEKEVLFVGRYLLVKLYSGRPLIIALKETTESKGVAAGIIKEIVRDIETGNPIEEALRQAMVYSPSTKLRKILFHINNALKLGIDVTRPLESVLEELAKDEELEIKKYSKKLNSLVIFYMLAAVIVPSLGMAIFIVITSFISFPLDFRGLMVILFFIIVLQFIFITLFKSIRPTTSL